VLPPAKNLDDMSQIVRTIRSGRPAELTETPAEPSHLVAPSGLIATSLEREVMAAAAAGNGGNGARRVPAGVEGG